MKLKIDTVGYDTKPKEFTTINNRLTTIPAQEIDFETFCDLVGNKGHAFCVSDFIENTRNKCTRSFSRADIDNDPDVFENIKKENPDTDNIITFFKYKKQSK